MNAGSIVAIAVVLLLLAVGVFVVTARRHDSRRGQGGLSRETRKRDRSGRDDEEAEEPPAPTGRELEPVAVPEPGALEKSAPQDLVPYVPPDPETIGVTRRQFFNRSLVGLTVASLAGFGAAVVGFLWAAPKGGFGGKISAGSLEDVNTGIAQGSGFFYVPEARTWLTSYPAGALPRAESVYPEAVLVGMRAGINALYQKCPHLGCRVPECISSQWFECPCHGSQYNRAGEKKAGPAPRGMDRFGVDVSGGTLTIDTGTIFQGPSIGTNTTGQEAEGPHCVSGGEH